MIAHMNDVLYNERLQLKVSCELFWRNFLIIIYLILFCIFAGTSFHSFALNLYLVNTFVAKEICEIPRYHILLNVLHFLIVGIVVAECVGDTL